MASSQSQRLFIVSNRLPIVLAKDEAGQMVVRPGCGGLVTALAPVLRNRGGVWVGWPGMTDFVESEVQDLVDRACRANGYAFELVNLTEEDVRLYYQGFSNEVIWPLFHDLQTHCRFDPAYWEGYRKVNETFADHVAKRADDSDFIWVHDYQLMLLGQELKHKKGFTRTGFFLHIPFPPPDIFLKLPWRFQIIRALLDYELIGFQTMRDRRNFLQCVKTLIKEARHETAAGMHTIRLADRSIRVGCFPISIDAAEFQRLSATPMVELCATAIDNRYQGKTLVLSVDRLDYTKGITYRLQAFHLFLQQNPAFHRKITLVQAVVPSRVDIPKYQDLKEEIDRQVAKINDEFGDEGWTPVDYLFRALTKAELLAYYKKADVALVTPVKDGMNLVSKEYIASRHREKGVLILSEFAGAACQLHKQALLVNPYDVQGIADALSRACTMSATEKRLRMQKMQRNVMQYDIYWWVRAFMGAAFSRDLADFPIIQEYIPEEQETALNSYISD